MAKPLKKSKTSRKTLPLDSPSVPTLDPNLVKARQEEFTSNFDARLKQDGIGQYASPPDMLYHYTTADGLKGIIINGNIWATNYRYVNDLTEYVYANELLRADIASRIQHPNPIVDAVLKAILNTEDLLVGAVDIFIACFCKEKDLLSQWRYYGGRGGGGYAIGFGRNTVTTQLIGASYQLYQVCYNERIQHLLIKDLLDSFCNAVEQLGIGLDPTTIVEPVISSKLPARDPTKPPAPLQIKSNVPAPLGELCMRLSFGFLELACCFKNPSFAIEEEWRLVHKRFSETKANTRNVSFRTSGATLIPYVELPLFIKDHSKTGARWNYFLDEIVCGPGLNNRVTEKSLQYLTAILPHQVAINHSAIKVKV
jgi:hypothetical protein